MNAMGGSWLTRFDPCRKGSESESVSAIHIHARKGVMEKVDADKLMEAVKTWAAKRNDVRAMALAGSWARGNPSIASDLDVVLLTDRASDYRNTATWLTQIEFGQAGYRVQSSKSAIYGVAWSEHVHLQPDAEVELTFAKCSWASTDPIDEGTRRVVGDAFLIVFDKDRSLQRLAAPVGSA